MQIKNIIKTTFFYLLDYVTLCRISKCGDGKKTKIKLSLYQICAKASNFSKHHFY